MSTKTETTEANIDVINVPYVGFKFFLCVPLSVYTPIGASWCRWVQVGALDSDLRDY